MQRQIYAVTPYLSLSVNTTLPQSHVEIRHCIKFLEEAAANILAALADKSVECRAEINESFPVDVTTEDDYLDIKNGGEYLIYPVSLTRRVSETTAETDFAAHTT